MSADLVLLAAVSKRFGDGDSAVNALQGIDLTVRQGEFLSLMGPSGSGKSTLLNLMGGLDQPTAGEVFLRGHALHRMRDDELSRIRRLEIGFVFQFFNLMPTMTVLENVALPLLLDGKTGRAVNERALEMLRLVGLEHRAGSRPGQLSGGQMQRVAIARALVAGPALLLADEPTGNLDSVMGQEVLHLLKTCQGSLGQTIVMVTHDPKAAAYGDRIVTIRDGRIASDLEVGTHAPAAAVR
ncbi:MAG: ABC transporter ATP-binding protein [Bacillota bacterium]